MFTGLEKEKEEDRKRTSFTSNQKEGDHFWKRGHVQEEVEKWNHETLVTEQDAEEARRKKELLLARMREIDDQSQDYVFQSSPSEARRGTTDHTSPRPPEQRNRNASIFTDSEESRSLPAGSREGGRRRAGIDGGAVTGPIGRRALRNQISSDDLAFGGYAPSFGHSASRASPVFPPPPPKEDKDSALEAIGIFNLRGTDRETEKAVGKDKKSSLMQQLFGAQATPAGDSASPSNKMEVLNSPPATNGVRSREGLLSFSSGSSTPPASSINTVHVTDSRPAYRAITSFDDDIEELTL